MVATPLSRHGVVRAWSKASMGVYIFREPMIRFRERVVTKSTWRHVERRAVEHVSIPSDR
jgi:hypothetical protein